jgi:hypothetical protein
MKRLIAILVFCFVVPMVNAETLLTTMGCKYVGEVIGDKAHGRGVEIDCLDGSEYIGKYRNGLYDGQGDLKIGPYARFIGEFRNDNFIRGIVTSEGKTFVGEFKNGELPWNGILFQESGNVEATIVKGKRCNSCKPTSLQTNFAKRMGVSKAVEHDPADLVFWQSIDRSNNANMYWAYLDEYPRGKFSNLAKIKLKELAAKAPDAVAPWNLQNGKQNNKQQNFISCCKICEKGKACGNSCIRKSYNCTKPKGCACDK